MIVEIFNNKNKTNDAKLHEMRFFAQIAEKSGYTIAGIGSAYTMNGTDGVIYFGLVMLIFASVQSQIISIGKFNFTNNSLKLSLLFRMLSFGVFSYGLYSENFNMMLLGAALSGLFVGLFWPAFYDLKSEKIGKWHMFEKISGVVLIIATGVLVLYFDPLFVLIVSTIASSISFWKAAKIENKQGFVSSKSIPLQKGYHREKAISILDGFNGESIRMIRRLAILSGAVTIMNFDGILSFALVLGISEALGAILKQYTNFKFLEFSIITTVGCLFCGIMFDYWIIGLILIGIGTAGIFPMVHEYVRARVSSDDINFRERNRFNGRIVGAGFASVVYVASISFTVVFGSVLVSTYLIWTMTR